MRTQEKQTQRRRDNDNNNNNNIKLLNISLLLMYSVDTPQKCSELGVSGCVAVLIEFNWDNVIFF